MRHAGIAQLIQRIRRDRLEHDLFHLSHQPIPMRKLNLTLPGHDRCTLYEADAFLSDQLQRFHYAVSRDQTRVQAFRCDTSKPKARQYSRPEPDDPWYIAHNLIAEKRGSQLPTEIILLLAHKDSQSWVNSPGAYDNCVGTIATLEIARVIAELSPRRTIRFLFCNEEHTPWTSVTAAQTFRQRGDHLVAVFNTDGIGGKSQQEIDAGKKTNVTLYTSDDGRELAQLMVEVNRDYQLGLQQRIVRRTRPGDDDGSFVRAGYGRAIANIGSYPYADAQYHREGDTPERVDLANVELATRAVLAAVLERDRR